jgi:hypothetical protein
MSSDPTAGMYSRARPNTPGGPVRGEIPMPDIRADDEAAIQAVLADSYKAWEAGDADGMVGSSRSGTAGG